MTTKQELDDAVKRAAEEAVLRFAHGVVCSLDSTAGSLLNILREFMRRRDLFSLQCLRTALLDPANESHLAYWREREISMAITGWLGDSSHEHKQFALDWIRDFKGSSEEAWRALHRCLRDRDHPFDVSRAKLLTGLAVEITSAGDVADHVFDVLIDMMVPRGDEARTPDRLAYFEFLLGMNLLPPCQASKSRVMTPSVMVSACCLEHTEWLDAVVRFYGDDIAALQTASCDAMHEILTWAAYKRSHWFLRAARTGVSRGWVDTETGGSLLSTLSAFDDDTSTPTGLQVCYAGLLVFQSRMEDNHNEENEELEIALDTVRRLHAAGTDLDTVVTVNNAVPRMHGWRRTDAAKRPRTWTGTMLHMAVEQGHPALVALLLRLGCDPTIVATVEFSQKEAQQTWDCFERIDQLMESSSTGEGPGPREEAIAETLRACKAYGRAATVMDTLLADKLGSSIP